MEFRETKSVNLFSKCPQRKLVIIKEGEQSLQKIQILKKNERKRNTVTSWGKKNGDSDSDASVKISIPKKNCKHHILDSDHDDDDSSDGVLKENFMKKGKKIKNNSHDALLEREHDS